MWGIVDFINETKKYYKIGIYIRGYNDVFFDPHGIFSPITGKILDISYSKKRFKRVFKHKILIDPTITSNRSKLIKEPTYKLINFGEKTEIYKTKENKEGILKIIMKNIEFTIEVGKGYITKSLALYNNIGNTVITGQQLGDILIGSYSEIKIKKPVKLFIEIGDNLIGGVSPNPIGKF